jgi:Family of unknown function (DUF5985)
MNTAATSALLGAISMASLVAALLFARFWRRTRDELFFFFSIAFLLDSITRFAMAIVPTNDEFDAIFYSSRLLTFGLIILAIIQKNRTKRK